MNVVRVLVSDNDFEMAKNIITAWQTNEVTPTQGENTRLRQVMNVFNLVLIFVAGLGSAAWYLNPPIVTNGIDYNHDGVLDEKWHYKRGVNIKTEIDRNLDGKIDSVTYFNRKGIAFLSKEDDNFDGVFETRYQYKNGSLLTMEADTNNDGETDYIAHFRNSVLHEVKLMSPGYGTPQKRQFYKMGKLVYSKIDANGDGVYDIRHDYNFIGEISKTTKIESQ